MMRKRMLANRRMVITGASRGIGLAVAELAAAEGAQLLLAARSAEPLHAVAARLAERGAEVAVLAADITQPADREKLLAAVRQRWGGLDVLLNNAGVGSWGHFASSSEAILRKVMELNFFAPAELIRQAIPLLQCGDRPAIVNVSSMCGRRGIPAWSEYSASKFALVGLTEALRAEMTLFEIDVLLIVPGLTRTEYFDNLLRKDGRMRLDFTAGMQPAEVAAGILRSLAGNRAETTLGREARWVLRMNRLLPRLVDRLMAWRVRQLYSTSEAGSA